MNGILPVEIRQRRSKANYTHLEYEMIKRQYAEIASFFSADRTRIYDRGYVDPSVFHQTLDRLRQENTELNGCQTAWSLGDLVAFEIWLQEFFVENRLN